MTKIKLTKEGKANKKILYDWLKHCGEFKAFINNLRLSEHPSRVGYDNDIPWKETFIEACNENPEAIVANAFYWETTPEGCIYWDNVYSNWQTFYFDYK